MIGIGINDNVVIGKETKTNREKGWLEIQFKSPSLSEDKQMEAAFEGKEIKEYSTKQNIFPPKTDAYINGAVAGRKTSPQIMSDIQKHVQYLQKILKCFMTTEELEEDFGISLATKLSGTATSAALAKYLESDDNVTKLYMEIYDAFVNCLVKYKALDPVNPTAAQMVRLKLWRQKATNTYSTLPTGFDEWIEPMNVPVAKVVATKYDLTPFKGSLNIHRLSTEAPVTDAVPPEAVEVAQAMFNTMPDVIAPEINNNPTVFDE